MENKPINSYQKSIVVLLEPHPKNNRFNVLAIVCDGRRDLLQSLGETPIQMCQFHQVAIITR